MWYLFHTYIYSSMAAYMCSSHTHTNNQHCRNSAEPSTRAKGQRPCFPNNEAILRCHHLCCQRTVWSELLQETEGEPECTSYSSCHCRDRQKATIFSLAWAACWVIRPKCKAPWPLGNTTKRVLFKDIAAAPDQLIQGLVHLGFATCLAPLGWLYDHALAQGLLVQRQLRSLHLLRVTCNRGMSTWSKVFACLLCPIATNDF